MTEAGPAQRTVAATEVVSCPVCGGHRARKAFSVTSTRRFVFHKCTTCGLAYAWPRPTLEELDQIYSADYFSGDSGFGYDDYGTGQVNADRMWTSVSIWSTTPFDSTHRTLLDIGCATGEFAAAGARDGWESWGCEPSPAAEAAERKGVRTVSNLSDPMLPDHGFGLITAFDVIEHVISPLDFLRDARRLIAEDGVLLVETDNWATLGRRVKGVHWAQIRVHPPPEHINYFTVGSLQRAFRACGFEPVIVETLHGRPINEAIQALHQGRTVRTLANVSIAHALRALQLGASIRILATPS